MFKWTKFLGLILVIAFVSSAYGDDLVGARPLGMGRTFVAIANDANAIDWNPAGISAFQYLSIGAGFHKLYWGISGDNIGIGHFSVANQLRDLFGYGISWNYLFSDVYYEHHFKLALAHRFGWKKGTFFGEHPLALGITTRFDGIGYNTKGFVNNPDEMTHIAQDPVFANGTSKWGISLDFGVLWRITPNITAGATAMNLLQPDFALQSSGELVDTVRAELANAGKHPMHLRLGVSWSPNPGDFKNFLVSADVRYFKEGSGIFTPHLGVEKWFYGNTVGVRSGFNPNELAVGLGWRLNREWSVEVDYAFVYPLSKLAKAGAQSQKFSAQFQIPNPIPVWDLVSIEVVPQIARVKPGDEVPVVAKFKNASGKRIKEAKYAIYTRKPDATYELVSTGKVDDLSPKEEREVTATFRNFQPGEYTLFASIDDEGSNIPKISGKIDELDEGNNVSSNTLKIFPPPVPTISFDQDTLHITRVVFKETEVPVVPVIFFDANKAELEQRYKDILAKVAQRLKKNPDIVVKVKGFYDPESDGAGNTQIALARRDAVYDFLVQSMGGETKQIIKDPAEDAVSLGQLRAGGGERYVGFERYIAMVQHENRRVELVPQFPSLAQSQVERVIKYKSGEIKKDVDFADQLMTFKSILEKNPNAMLLLEGYAIKGEGPNLLEPAFGRAAYLKEILKRGIPFYLWDRIFAWGDDRHAAEGGEPYVKISLLPDAVVYQPFEGRSIPKGSTVENPQNFVKLSAKGENKIVSHSAELMDLAKTRAKVFSATDGMPPAGLPWDWKTDGNEYIQAGKYYVGHITVVDELGAAGEAYSETLVVNQVDKIVGLESMLLTVFQFDKDIAISPYYHSRMEAIARRFIELAEHEQNKISLIVTGHTDIIGLSRRNQELSETRAQTEFNNLKVYLRHMLGIPDNEKLQKWMTDNNAEMKFDGYGPDKPYAVKLMRDDGSIEEHLLGDNQVPEGRAINRRVLVEFRVSGVQ